MTQLHAPTVTAMLLVIAFATGGLLLLSWRQNRSIVSPALWGVSNLLGGVAAGLYSLHGVAPDILSIDFANAVAHLAFGLGWAGMRRLRGQPAPVWIIVTPALSWLLLCQWNAFDASLLSRVTMSSGIKIGFAVAAVWELSQLRSEALVSRVPTMVWLLFHAFCIGIRIPLSMLTTIKGDAFAESSLFALALFEGLLNMVVLSFLQIALIRERAENQQRHAAMTDLLTGAPNRRALFEDGAALLSDARAHDRPVSCLVIDIDHFKSVNDQFGHEGGDAALIAVASAMRAHLRSGDYFARLGGEEFVCLLPDASMQTAMIVAEGLRARIAGLALDYASDVIRVSISIGVACKAGAPIGELLCDADRSLYDAKLSGRNRVSARETQPLREQTTLRVA